ncbi:hypothetical protein EE612_033214, partial [Oryza sativa]
LIPSAADFPNIDPLSTTAISQPVVKQNYARNHLTSAHDRGHGCSNSLLTSAEGVHFTHTTLLTWITQPVGISYVGRPPSFHDKTFPKPTQVYHMSTRGVPDQQQVRSQTILCQEAQGSSPTPPRRIHMSLGIKAPLIS